ncbi:hypothetical protein QN277_014512 [Acacia crassicarpa]|uniref:Uncharacterized protein n=1 Tax=Acacia crassicarpa TaxID=499986 RepID=A0AAE1MAF8_9FABA|nr:hypothetical protein QN277_014512 [Acacia crassicarpa]
MQQGPSSMSNADLGSTHLPQDPFQVQPNMNNMESAGIAQKAKEKYNHENEMSSSDMKINPRNIAGVEQESVSSSSPTTDVASDIGKASGANSPTFSDTQQGPSSMSNVDLGKMHLPEDPIQVQPNMNNMESAGVAQKVEEKYDHENEMNSSDVRTDPRNKAGVEQESVVSSSLRTDVAADIGKASGANSPAFSDMQQGPSSMSNADLGKTHLLEDPFQVQPNMNNMESAGVAQKVEEKYDQENEMNSSDMRTGPRNIAGVEQESMASSSLTTDVAADIGKASGANSPAFSDMQQGHSIMSNADLGKTHLLEDPFQVRPNMNSMESAGVAQKVEEKYDHENEMNNSDMRTNPRNTAGVEQESVASSSLTTDRVADIGKASGANSPAVNPSQNFQSGGSQYPEIQKPPLQVMEDNVPSGSFYKIPSHVFNRTSANVPEWSIASNDSLFSIHTGTMSFTREVPWFKSGELDKYGDMIMPGLPNSFQSNHLLPGNKFNDMSQRTAEQDQGIMEAKAAETMREVIMENTQKNTREEPPIIDDEDGTSQAKVLSDPNNKSGHSDVSAKSFSFQPLTGDGSQRKNGSSKHGEKKAEKQRAEESKTGAEALNSAQKAWNKRWRLSCFACCAFCR